SSAPSSARPSRSAFATCGSASRKACARASPRARAARPRLRAIRTKATVTEEGSMSERVVVIGAGTMGRGIAQIAAAAGYDTHLHDVDAKVVEAAVETIGVSMARRVDQGKMTVEARQATLDRLTAAPFLGAAVAEAAFVIEAVPERMDLKVE